MWIVGCRVGNLVKLASVAQRLKISVQPEFENGTVSQVFYDYVYLPEKSHVGDEDAIGCEGFTETCHQLKDNASPVADRDGRIFDVGVFTNKVSSAGAVLRVLVLVQLGLNKVTKTLSHSNTLPIEPIHFTDFYQFCHGIDKVATIGIVDEVCIVRPAKNSLGTGVKSESILMISISYLF